MSILKHVMPMKEYRGELVLTEQFVPQDVVVITKKVELKGENGEHNGFTTIQYLDIPVRDIEFVISFLRAFV